MVSPRDPAARRISPIVQPARRILASSKRWACRLPPRPCNAPPSADRTSSSVSGVRAAEEQSTSSGGIALSTEVLGDRLRVPAPPRCKRPLVVRERRVGPAGLGVPEEVERVHDSRQTRALRRLGQRVHRRGSQARVGQRAGQPNASRMPPRLLLSLRSRSADKDRTAVTAVTARRTLGRRLSEAGWVGEAVPKTP
jgi:hypothetical protein